VQIVHAKRRGARRMEHVGSAHDEQELEALKAAAAQRLAFLSPELDLGLDGGDGGGDSGGDSGAGAVGSPGPLPILSSRAGALCDGLAAAYDTLGFEQASGADEVFRLLVLARIIEPTSKQDSLRVLAETGVDPVPSYATLKRRLPVWGTDAFRRKLAAACAAHAGLGPASLVLYDVSTLYFETDAGDGFREPGFSKERRLEPQITIGLLTDAAGFPLMVEAFEGNAAETTTMLPTIRAFMAAHQLTDVTVVADAGMISEGNKRAIEAAGLSFILGAKIPDIPYAVTEWRARHPDQEPPDGLILTQPRPAGPRDRRRDEVVYYQYRADRARRTLRGIDEQIGKAERAVAGKVPVKRNRFIKLVDAKKSVNRTLEAKARALARVEGLHHQPRHLPRRHTRHRRVRDRRLPPALPDRGLVPHVQARPRRPTDLPPQARVDRGAPQRRVRRPRGRTARRGPHRLVDPPLRAHRPPLPHRPDPRRPADHHRGRPRPRRSTRRAELDQSHRRGTLI
jgi:hypothetical protein